MTDTSDNQNRPMGKDLSYLRQVLTDYLTHQRGLCLPSTRGSANSGVSTSFYYEVVPANENQKKL